MKWVSVGGYGHAVVERLEPAEQADVPDGGWRVACGRTLANEAEGVEVGTLQERPYGADTCSDCHGKVKTWAADPTKVPEGVETAPAPHTAESRPLTRAERDAVLRGERPEPVSVQGDRAPGRADRPASSRPATPEPADDVVFPDEGAGPSVVGGAVFVAPEPGKKSSKSKREAADVEIDSE